MSADHTDVCALTDDALLKLALKNADSTYMPELVRRFRAWKQEALAAEQAWQAVVGVLRSLLRYLPNEAKSAIQEIIDQE